MNMITEVKYTKQQQAAFYGLVVKDLDKSAIETMVKTFGTMKGFNEWLIGLLEKSENRLDNLTIEYKNDRGFTVSGFEYGALEVAAEINWLSDGSKMDKDRVEELEDEFVMLTNAAMDDGVEIKSW